MRGPSTATTSRWSSSSSASWLTCASEAASTAPTTASVTPSSGASSSTSTCASRRQRPRAEALLVDQAGGLVARAGPGVPSGSGDRRVDAQAFLHGGRDPATDLVGVAGRPRLDPDDEGRVLGLRLDDLVLEGGLGHGGDGAQSRLQLADLEALALARQEVLEAPAPPAPDARLATRAPLAHD